MIEKGEVEKLSELARIEISEDEKAGLMGDLDVILGYVSEVREVITGDVEPTAGRLRNVMRKDVDPYEVGKFTEEIMEGAPNRDGDYIKVKKIL